MIKKTSEDNIRDYIIIAILIVLIIILSIWYGLLLFKEPVDLANINNELIEKVSSDFSSKEEAINTLNLNNFYIKGKMYV